MSFFQKSVVSKYLNNLNKATVSSAFLLFKEHFLNPDIQKNIRSLKEEQYQQGFFNDLFVKVLGYTLSPNSNFNLLPEYKNEKDSKKADGAIVINGNVRAVIELKDTKTTDLGKVETQAFGYKNNQKDCPYVIISNFEKLRFYVDNSVDCIEFNLFTLSEEDFTLLYLILSFESIEKDIPKKLKDETVNQDDITTKKLYNDYSVFKKELFQNLIAKNPNFDKLTLFKKSQKLIDRLLFIFFAEDRGLLPPNSVRQIIQDWQKLGELDSYAPLYSRFQKFFGYLNTGYQSATLKIFAYNGGLFEPDEVLDSISIDDEILNNHTLKLSNYDFETEVDVNILGHIFEHSLNEIEEIQSELEGKVPDKSKSKRKKDGIFYTPKYITKYIVENTLGTLCSEKRIEFGLNDDETEETKRKAEKKDLLERIDSYRKWLLELTICDPACGSGAFLNQALDFLLNEHRRLDELTARTLDLPIVFSDIENSVLENNIFGVDINEEAVEIAKLSLWLRTAQRGRKLNTLSNNIKCGNSLIDDPAVAGDKAFNWQEEFPQIFAKGGFDVVIGNPPYVNAIEIKKSSSQEEYNFLKRNYKTAKGTVDLYIYFFEKGLNLIKNEGILSYITPNRFLSASYGKALRELILNEYELKSLIDYSDKKVFSDASTYPVISIFRPKTKNSYFVITGKFDEDSKILLSKEYPSQRLNILQDSILGFLLNDKLIISEKIINNSIPLENCGLINATSTTNEADEYSKLVNEVEGIKLINTGTIDSYTTSWGNNTLTDKGKKYLTPYLSRNNNIISKNRILLYNSPKIIIAKIGLKCEAFYDKNGEYASINTNCIHSFKDDFLPEFILCWINSKLYNYIFECLFDGLRMSGGYLLYSSPNLKNTYIKKISPEAQQPFIEKADLMLKLNKDLQEGKNAFISFIRGEFNLDKISTKLEEWYTLPFDNFTKELEKLKVKLTSTQKYDLKPLFDREAAKLLAIKSEIETTDREIDQMVYKLYDLTPEEIKIVEGE